MAVIEVEVRNLLDGPAATSVPSATITENINRSVSIVDTYKATDAPNTKVDHAIRAVAVWLSYGSYMEGVTQQLGNISLADQIKLDHLKEVAELFVNQVSRSYVNLSDMTQTNSLQGIDPSVFGMTTSEAYRQS